jgi:hypothetical protein
MMNKEGQRKTAVVASCVIPSQHFSGGTEENKSEELVFRPRFKLGTS